MPQARKIRVVVVDDSAAFRAALALALAADPEIEIAGQAADGEEAVALVERLRPDVVTMDVVMPKVDGIEASRRILATPRPVPILLLTTLARSEEQRMALNALRLGVVDVTNKPVLVGKGAAAGAASIIGLVKAAAVVHLPSSHRPTRLMRFAKPEERQIELVAIAASTGGPPAIERLLSVLPRRLPPVVIAQHLAPSFHRGFAQWLASSVGREIKTIEHAEMLRANTIYVAGEHSHVRIGEGVVERVPCGATELSPNADVLFESVATAFGAHAVGVVLTGMGNDGAVGLLAMKDAGAWTIAQDADSSVVYGMPRVAWNAGACCEQLSLEQIGTRLAALISSTAAKRSG
jgi:two-component system chemotaxis response regulator CheB